MSILSKIRNRIGLVVGFIAVALLVFIVTTALNSSGSLLGGDRNSLGSVNGENISSQLYEMRYEEFARNSQQPANTPDEVAQLRDNAWRNIVGELLLKKEYNKLGLGLTDEMLSSFFVSDNPHPFVANHPAFVDSTRRYSKEVARNRMANYKGVQLDGSELDMTNGQIVDYVNQIRQIINDLERNMEADYLFKTYKGLIDGGMFVSKNEAVVSQKEQTQSANISYLKVDVSSIPNDQVKPEDSDYRTFYNNHRERFRRKAPEATIKYAYVIKTPSADDSAGVKKSLADLAVSLHEDTDPFTLAIGQSDGPVDTNYTPIPFLPAFVSANLSALKKDTVLGPVLENGLYQIARVVNTRDDSTSFYKVRHILVKMTTDSTKSRNRASVIERLATSNFEQTVKDSSDDFKTRATGGDLGWMGLKDRGPKWEEKLKNAGSGSYFRVEDKEGIHICQVTDKSSRSVQLAVIQKNVFVSSATSGNAYDEASKFQGEALNVPDLDSLKAKFPAMPVSLSMPLAPNSIDLKPLTGARPVIAWALMAEKGDVSPVIEVENAFVVAQKISGGGKGYKDLEEVKKEIEGEVIASMKARMILEKLSAIQAADLDAMSKAYGPGAVVETAQNITFANPMAAGIGNEPYVIGKIFGMKPGTTSGPIAGQNGVFVIRLDGMTESPAPAEDALAGVRTSLRATKKQSFFNKVYYGLEELGNVQDNRYVREAPGAGM